MPFRSCIGIDYSGAGTSGQPLGGLQVFEAKGGPPERVPPPGPGRTSNWSRQGIAEWLIGLARVRRPFLAGIDHAFGFPMAYLEEYRLAESTWDHFLDDFAEHWPTDQPGVTVQQVRERGSERAGHPSELRLTERWTVSAKSVFLFDVQGQVAKSTHAGLPWLRRIRREAGSCVHFWPFDGWEIPEGKSAIVEVYPALFRKRYADDCAHPTAHQIDACCVARWLQAACANGFLSRYLDPPLTPDQRRAAEREGWILGVM